MEKRTFLKTTAIDNIFNSYKKNIKNFYLGKFCISDNLEFDVINKYNSLNSNWLSRKNNIKTYKFLEKVSKKLLKHLTIKLNKIHNRNESSKYWKVILYPWVCYYVNTTYDRWKIVTKLKSLRKKFFTYEYNLPDEFLKIIDLNDWYNKIANDSLNNHLFVKIIKFQKFKNIKIVKKKIDKVFVRKPIKIDYRILNLTNFFDKLLSEIGFYFNKLYIDKFYFPKLSFLWLCLKNLQVPAKNISSFENFKSNKDLSLKLRAEFRPKKQIKNEFENFLYNNLKNFLPMSYLENFETLISNQKKKTKKRLFIGMYSVHWNDEFKIHLSESIKLGSKYYHANHGAGIEGKYDPLHNHFYEISNKIISQNKKNLGQKFIYLGSTIFKNRKKKLKSEKLLINYHEPERFFLRVPLTTPALDINIDNFISMMRSMKKLKKNIINNIKFRPKGNDGYNSELRFSRFFNNKLIEKISSKDYTNSILESKLVICNIPQTSFTECIYLNVPTILILNNSGYFDTARKRRILKIFLKANLAFKNYKDGIKFINNNWNFIDKWWDSKKVVNARKTYLDEFYSTESNYFNKWDTFLKKNLKFKNN